MSPRRPAPLAAEAARRARFETLFRQVYQPLQSYVARRVAAEAVDDAVADTLLVLWRRLEDVPAEMALPWAYGVARRCVANARRGDVRRGQLVQRLSAQPVALQPDAADDTSGLQAALASMSDDDRELIRLWAWEQLQPREIAIVLGISPNAVSIRLHRAKRELAEHVAGRDRADGTGRVAGKDRAAGGHTGVGHSKEAP